MSKPAFTLKAFGIYLLVLGVGLTVAPNQMLSLFSMPLTTEVWLRVVGVLVFNIGIYYIYAAKCEARAFFQVSVYTRCLVMAAFIAFVALGLAPPMLVLFGVADLLGAIWTQLALRGEARAT